MFIWNISKIRNITDKFCVLVFVDSTFVYKWRRNLLVTSLREFSTFVNQHRMICRLWKLTLTMVKQTIKIFARVKPTKSRVGVRDDDYWFDSLFTDSERYKLWFLHCYLLFQLYEIDDDDEAIPRLTLSVPRDLKDGFINNKKENYKFRYDRPPSQHTQKCPSILHNNYFIHSMPVNVMFNDSIVWLFS